MLEESIKVSKQYLYNTINEIYIPCRFCYIAYGKTVANETRFKCCVCYKIEACGRIFCTFKEKYLDFSTCVECGLFTCSNCPDSCTICATLNCINCMKFCRQCDKYVCKNHYNRTKDKCFKCIY